MFDPPSHDERPRPVRSQTLPAPRVSHRPSVVFRPATPRNTPVTTPRARPNGLTSAEDGTQSLSPSPSSRLTVPLPYFAQPQPHSPRTRGETDSVSTPGPADGSDALPELIDLNIPVPFSGASLGNPFGSSQADASSRCEFCQTAETNLSESRNLVLCFDGTSNKFGKHNTNVVELYYRIIKDDTQLSYYNSGIGTYARPSWRSFTFWKKVINHKIDLAIAWDFEKVLLAGYRWLSDHYQPGDKIYLFGFSRGAYQVRVLAGMIASVGLILPGNEEQIPFAFELYADLNTKAQGDAPTMAVRFKETFARENVKIHFVGAWDTVSSIGIIRGKNMPGTDVYNSNICYFRHALALDERRVKFLPEYVCGGVSYEPEEEESSETNRRNGTGARVKEVWFAGCHSDIGGGSQPNEDLNNAAVPVLWMANEARFAGLKLNPSRVQWNWEELVRNRPNESLTFTWRILEVLPFKRLTYRGHDDTTWWPHLSRGRVIQPGQKIHASVCFIGGGYSPKARFSERAASNNGVDWSKLVGAGLGKRDGLGWAQSINHVLEMDLFDLSNVEFIVDELKRDRNNVDLIGRLDFLASIDEGAQTILSIKGSLQLVLDMFKNPEKDGMLVFAKLIGHKSPLANILSRSEDDFINSLEEIIQSQTSYYALDSPEATLFIKVAERLDMQRLPFYVRRHSLAASGLSLCDAVQITANLYLMRYRSATERRASDIDRAESLLGMALNIANPPTPESPGLLTTLAEVIRTKASLGGTEDAEGQGRIPDSYFHNPSAIDAVQRAVNIAREQAKDGEPASLGNLAMTLYGLSMHLYSPHHRKETLQAIKESVEKFEDLHRRHPDEFTGDLALANSTLSFALSGLGQREEAVRRMEQAAYLYEELARKVAYSPHSQFTLADTLVNLSVRLAASGDYTRALAVAERSMSKYRRLREMHFPLSPNKFAACFDNYSDRLSDLGRLDAALDAAQKAVDLRKSLAEDKPGRYDIELVRSLQILSLRLSATGRSADALGPASEAVGRCRALAATHPTQFNSELARCLLRLSKQLRDLGHREEGMIALKEAVEMYSQVARNRPAEFNRDFATSLFQLSEALSSFGRYSEALEPIEESVGIIRQLAAEYPDLHKPILALHLDGLSDRLAELGRHEEALAAVKEAVEIVRSFFNSNVANTASYFKSILSTTLVSLSKRSSAIDSGTPESAVDAAEEAVNIRRELAEANGRVHIPKLSLALIELSNRLARLHRDQEALVAAEEATDLCQRLANDYPSVYNSDLSSALVTQSLRHSALGNHTDALVTVTQALEIRRQLAVDLPEIHTKRLAEGLAALAEIRSAFGLLEEALNAGKLAVELYRRLANQSPSGFNSVLSDSLYRLSIRYHDLFRNEEAVESLTEAIGIRQELATALPDAHAEGLARCKSLLGSCFSDLGRSLEAVEVAKEAVETYRQLERSRPSGFSSDLSEALSSLSSTYIGLGSLQEALDTLKECIEITRQLSADSPELYKTTLASRLCDLSELLASMGQHEGGVEAVQQAIELHRSLADDSTSNLNPELALSLGILSSRFSELGRFDQALEAQSEAVDIARRLPLAGDVPLKYKSCRAWVISKLSDRLAVVGRFEESLAAAKEGEELYRSLAQDDSTGEAFKHNHAVLLSMLSGLFSRLGRQQESLDAMNQSLDLHRQLANELPLVYKPTLASTLITCSGHLAEMQSYERAVKFAEEAVSINRLLVRDIPSAYSSDLATSLHVLSRCLAGLNRPIDALSALEEAVEHRRRLAVDLPSVFNRKLAISFKDLSNQLSGLGRKEDALKGAERAVELLRPLASEHPLVFRPDLAGSLDALSHRLSELGRLEYSLQVGEEAVELYRQVIANPRRPLISDDVQKALDDLVDHLSELRTHLNDQGVVDDITASANGSPVDHEFKEDVEDPDEQIVSEIVSGSP